MSEQRVTIYKLGGCARHPNFVTGEHGAEEIAAVFRFTEPAPTLGRYPAAATSSILETLGQFAPVTRAAIMLNVLTQLALAEGQE